MLLGQLGNFEGLIFDKAKDLLENLVEACIAEGQADAPVVSQILAAMHVSHLDDEFLNSLQTDDEVLGGQVEEVAHLGDHAFGVGVIEPLQLDYSGKYHDHHLEHLLLGGRALVHEVGEQVGADGLALLWVNFLPLVDEELLEPACGQILRVCILRLFEEVA